MYPRQLSIIIVNFNTSNLLINCINSIYENAESVDFEIIVVDNDSSDDSTEKIKEMFHTVKLIENKQNVGFAKACNQAIEKCSGSIVLLLNTDTIILDHAIEKSYRFIIDWPDAGVVGCKLLNDDLSIQPSCRSFPSIGNFLSESFFLYKFFPKSRLFGSPYMTFQNYDKVMTVDVVMGAFMMIKRSIINDIGFFDERFFMYSEETDFCFRTHRSGSKVYYFPDAHIIHYGGASSEPLSTTMFLELHKSHIKYCQKHHRKWYVSIEKSVLFYGVLIRYIYANICAIFNKNNLEFINRKDKYLKALRWYNTGAKI